jgi:hypothetical protein
MQIDLTEQRIGQKSTFAVKECDTCFVAGRFESQNTHGQMAFGLTMNEAGIIIPPISSDQRFRPEALHLPWRSVTIRNP